MRKVADQFELAHAEPPREQPPAGTLRASVAAVADPTSQVAPGPAAMMQPRTAMSHVGRYRLRAVIAEGGPGAVYEAWDPLLSRAVAVKTLQFGLGMSSRISLDRRLLNDARVASHLTHRYIASVHDAGLSAHGVYLTMERLHGRDLRRALAEGWQPSVAESLKLMRRVADAVAYAHGRNVVHGDLKPSSIFIMRSGRPKLLNFGIARVLGNPAVPELEGLHLGWPHYQAPEQIERQGVDARSDVYSIGLVLYELLAGRPAFARDNLQSLRRAIAAGAWVPLDQIKPDLPAGIVRAVHAAIARDPAQRPASAQEFAQALRDGADGVSGGSRVSERPVAAVARAVRQMPSPFAAAVAWVSRHPAWRWPLTAGLLGLSAWALTAGARGPGLPEPLPPPAPMVQQPAAPVADAAPAPRLTPAAGRGDDDASAATRSADR